MNEKLIPFRIKKGHEPCEWHTEEGAIYKLGNPELQAKGLPEEVFKVIKKTGTITELKEKDDGNGTETPDISLDG